MGRAGSWASRPRPRSSRAPPKTRSARCSSCRASSGLRQSLDLKARSPRASREIESLSSARPPSCRRNDDDARRPTGTPTEPAGSIRPLCRAASDSRSTRTCRSKLTKKQQKVLDDLIDFLLAAAEEVAERTGGKVERPLPGHPEAEGPAEREVGPRRGGRRAARATPRSSRTGRSGCGTAGVVAASTSRSRWAPSTC